MLPALKSFCAMLAFAALYLLLAGSVSWAEVAASGVAGGLAAFTMALVAAEVPALEPPYRQAARHLRGVPRRAAGDTVTVLAAVARRAAGARLGGRFRVVPIDPGTDNAVSQGRRALVLAAASFAPNSVVVTIDAERGRMLLHELVPEPERPVHDDPEWPV